MAKFASGALLDGIKLDPNSLSPLYRQLYTGIRRLILSGDLPPGIKLPASRTIATELSISRTTVINTIEQMISEGFLETRRGAGTYVSHHLPAMTDFYQSIDEDDPQQDVEAPDLKLSRRGQGYADLPHQYEPEGIYTFRPSQSAYELLPHDVFSRLTNRYQRRPTPADLTYADRGGFMPLREAISSYLKTSRSIRCTPEQVIITSGTQSALHLISQLLLDPGDAVWMEDPGHMAARCVFEGSGANVVPVPLDEHGFNPELCPPEHKDKPVKLAYVTPSSQHPLGCRMPLTRRIELLDWAQQNDAWIFEDDYNSEFRYTGRPLAALQGLDKSGRVLYVGSFTKILYPGIRLGYMIVPGSMSEAFAHASTIMQRSTPKLIQQVITDFINEGFFATHMRKMRKIYDQRQKVLLAAAEEHLKGLVNISPVEQGFHCNAWLPDHVDAQEIEDILRQAGYAVNNIDYYCIRPYRRKGFMIGFAGTPEEEIPAGIQGMAKILRRIL
ncbi:PLP-dependent aminotransferase family protein [Kiloniella laminariae]|uniref:PLP-dependent aminotransferase family protein n=1 Tax=Kiloniella laminariae TaxID=454162 RepID=A0ABT4LDP8_9PROT|nr:PLP-dependent aminotransferase family protein [Kiloniella laminariae]MCZ4279216.1 PLP-dependent aminotransferase family protein [Kiloniella laminariae]